MTVATTGNRSDKNNIYQHYIHAGFEANLLFA